MVISEGVEYFGSNAFNGCKLTDISFPSTLTDCGILGRYRHADDIKLLGSHVTEDGNFLVINGKLAYARGVVRKSRETTLPEEATSIGEYAFYRSSIQLNIPKKITRICHDAFSNSYSKTITFNGNVVLEGSAFNINGITDIYLNKGSSFTCVGSGVFGYNKITGGIHICDMLD